jgi:CDP-diacylglycerol--glycerol-3-phosphate 3-phosphatidyltransferase
VRVVVISAGLVFASLGALEPAIYVLAALTSVTVLQRILHVKKQLTPAATL